MLTLWTPLHAKGQENEELTFLTFITYLSLNKNNLCKFL